MSYYNIDDPYIYDLEVYKNLFLAGFHHIRSGKRFHLELSPRKQERNEKKAAILYNFLDNSKLFKGTVVPEDRSLMNVPFVIGDDELEKKFISEAEQNGFVNLKGHRTVGGMRASIYNAMPIEGVEKLVEFMTEFEKENTK